MNLLAFDTSVGVCSVAIRKDEHVVARRHETLSKGHAERIVPMIQSVLTEADVRYGEIDFIAVTVGPGTFTGIRIGLSAARGIALTTGVPVIGVPTLDVIAEGARALGSLDKQSAITVFHDARRDELFCQVFPRVTDDSPSSPSLITLVDALSIIPSGGATVVGSGVSRLKDRIVSERPDVTISDAPNSPDAVHLSSIGTALARRGLTEKWPPEPLYIRAPDARLPAGP